ncbi:phosphatase PAP2 family protein [Sphingobacterium sp. SRCM116780]|uniref:phosphatase PAP2 family protein n=1 Tax=Sphingobacterium sp. SRCM116780 TaxID=2907623 RepID=UPI001F354ECF|nr:phosphatase PAP2 family protein [Sphingobacterium sp. SRCM116780]UIR54790.1 phosphatase PAP2 family protein [Sphingobacterium sp. SRCM116780]
MLNKFIKVNLPTNNMMNTSVIRNYSKLKRSLFFFPLFFLVTIVLFLYKQDSLHVDKYIQIQKDCFYFLNSKLSQFPNTIFNLTQLGDEIIILSFLSAFILYVPKIWESLISASLVSCIFSFLLKKTFAVPRPAAVFDHTSFVIIGKTLTGHNSLPSGHSITVFTVLTVLLFAFIPKKMNYKILWFIFMISIGLIIGFTRVGIGAHYPLDVIIGGIIGYISGLLGIFINEKYKIWTWINNKNYYLIFMLFFLICSISLINKIMIDHLIIFYLSLTSLLISLYKIVHIYVKK